LTGLKQALKGQGAGHFRYKIKKIRNKRKPAIQQKGAANGHASINNQNERINVHS
jgi:hypothetical protein